MGNNTKYGVQYHVFKLKYFRIDISLCNYMESEYLEAKELRCGLRLLSNVVRCQNLRCSYFPLFYVSRIAN
jgi:hypothetical protein